MNSINYPPLSVQWYINIINTCYTSQCNVYQFDVVDLALSHIKKLPSWLIRALIKWGPEPSSPPSSLLTSHLSPWHYIGGQTGSSVGTGWVRSLPPRPGQWSRWALSGSCSSTWGTGRSSAGLLVSSPRAESQRRWSTGHRTSGQAFY